MLAGIYPARAQLAGQDNAAQPAYGTGWVNGTNGGFGFKSWALTNNDGAGGGFAGAFIGGSGIGSVDTSGKSFGMYANSGSYNFSVAYRALSNSLSTTNVFRFKMKNEGIATDNYIGFSIRNGTAQSAVGTSALSDMAAIGADSRFSFYFQGGLNNYLIWDGSSVFDTGIPYTGAGLTLEFALRTADTYRLVVKSADGTVTKAVFDDMPLQGSGTIDSFALYNLNAGGGGNLYFNQFELNSTFLVPPEIVNFSPTNNSTFLSTNTAISFDVTSAFSSVSNSAIKVVINGATNTSATFSGTPASNHVNIAGPLPDNTLFNVVVTATDANGNKATSTFSFNTWRADNPYFEVEDYNFSKGQYGDNFSIGQPNQFYANLIGSNTIDYLEYDTTGTNHPNAYRPTDLPQIEVCSDVDHANFAANGFQDYNLGFVNNGEWLNFTRRMSNATFAVYARMAGLSGSSTMLLERLASPTATTTNQSRAALGTFVCPNTGNAQAFVFVPLKDMFGNVVQIRFPGTNTFRTTSFAPDGGYNLNYLMLAPLTNASTLRPYIASGFPYPGSTGVTPDQTVTYTVANRQTSVVTNRLYLNGTEVTSAITVATNAAGSVVTYHPTPFMLINATNTLTAIVGDGSVLQTNTWTFTTANIQTIPAGYAVSTNSGQGTGFAIHTFKITNSAPTTLFTSIFTAESELAGTIINTNTSLPYPNEAGGPNGDGRYWETGSLNYDITGNPSGSFTFVTKSPFPGVPAAATNNYIAMEARFYALLNPGIYSFAVRSDDGFRSTVGPTVCDTNMVLAEYILDRGNGTPTTYSFAVTATGLYPMRVLYWQGQFGGNIEFYSINRSNGVSTLINEAGNPSAVRTYPALKANVSNLAHAGNTTTFTFQTEACRTHLVQYVNSLTNANWQLLKTVAGSGSTTNIIDNTATGNARFYRIVTQ